MPTLQDTYIKNIVQWFEKDSNTQNGERATVLTLDDSGEELVEVLQLVGGVSFRVESCH